MSVITVRFSAELQCFLSKGRRSAEIIYPIDDGTAAKHPIESLGIPHTEIGLIAINGESKTFAARVNGGDDVLVYGIEDAPLLAGAQPLRPSLPQPPRFVLDTHLGKLARHLRLLGFDARYDNAFADDELAAISARESRILLTRDRGLLKHKIVDFGFCLRTTQTRQQLADVVRRYRLATQCRPYTRCLACNGVLNEVAKADVLPLLEPKTRRHFDEFKQCPDCQRVYWKGSHTERLDALLESIRMET